MKPITFAVAAAAAALSLTAQAKISSQSEFNGYSACVAAAAEEHTGLVPSRIYYLSEQGDKNVYYVNGTAWENGARVDVRIACDTTANGRTLLTQTSNYGRFAIEGGTGSLDVAAQ